MKTLERMKFDYLEQNVVLIRESGSQIILECKQDRVYC